MSPVALTVIVLAVISAVFGAVRMVRQSSQLGRLGRVAVARIGALTPGDQVVRVVGTVRALDATTIAGPYSGTPGVAAVFERWEKTSAGYRLRRLDRQVRHTTFLVEDDPALLPR